MSDFERASVRGVWNMSGMLGGRAANVALRLAGTAVGRVILALDPNNGAGLLLVGMAYATRGRFQNAKETLTRLLEVDAESFDGRLWLSHVALGTGRVADARRWAQEAIKLKPESQLGRAQLAECESALADLLPLAFCEQVSAAAERPVLASYGLGLALLGCGHAEAAIQMLERAIADDPLYLPAIRELVRLYRIVDDSEGELRAARQAAEVSSDPFALANLAFASISNGLKGEAQACLDKAIASGPHNADEMMEIGFVHRVLGDTKAAMRWFEASLKNQPKQGECYFWLSNSRRLTEEDRPWVDEMMELWEDPKLLPSPRLHLAFAIGKALEDLGDYEGAMKYFEEANQRAYKMRFGPEPYDAPGDTAFRDAIDRLINLDASKCSDISSDSSPKPIFIIGMMRSGTTLMEQILSSHPRVSAAGEQPFWSFHVPEPDKWDSIEPAQLRSLGDKYCEVLKKFGGDKDYVTDKRPDNYYRVGLLAKVFPEAKFIHMNRHPADNCLSILTTLNSTASRWQHTKSNITHFYKQYRKIMAHWHSSIPAGRILDVRYEELVAEPEKVIREICEFCGLEWDPVMLRPEENTRPVITPSVAQVRRPIYTSSVARWKNFEPWLDEILTLVPQEEIMDPLDGVA